MDGRPPLGQEVPSEIHGATPADEGKSAREPLLGLAATGIMQIGEKLEIGFGLALGRQRTGEPAGVDQMKAMPREPRIRPPARPDQRRWWRASSRSPRCRAASAG